MARQYRTFNIRKLVKALQGFSVKRESPGVIINRLLLDASYLLKLSPEEVEAEYEKKPLLLFGILEISQLASLFTVEIVSDRAFLEYFQKRPPTSSFLFFFSEVEDLSYYSTSGLKIYVAQDPADIVAFIQNVLRYAHLFYNWAPGDIFSLGKILHTKFLAGAVIWNEPDEFESHIIRALSALDLPLFSRISLYPYLNYINVVDMDDLFNKVRALKPTIGAHKAKGEGESQKLNTSLPKPKVYGGTYSSFFVVREMGGTDGVEVRGNESENVGLIVDIGDKNVDITLSHYIEEDLMQVFSHHPWMRFSEDSFFSITVTKADVEPVELGREVYDKLKERLLLNQVAVSLIFDTPRLTTLKPTISAYQEERKNALQRRSDLDAPLLICTYCQRYCKNGFCFVSVNHPPQCELSYDAVRASALLTNSTEAFSIEKGEIIDKQRLQFTGVNKFARILSEGEIKHVNLQSILADPPPTTAYAQNIAYLNEDVSGILILSRDFEGLSPDRKTYFGLLKEVVGAQVPGVMGVSDAYLKSKEFLSSEGGLGRVVWMPSVLKKRLGFESFLHIATERECNNMLLLKAFLKERGFSF